MMTKARFLGDRIIEFLKEYRTFIFLAIAFCTLVYLICFLFTIIIVIIYFIVNIYLLCDTLLYSPNYPPESRTTVDTPEKYNFKEYECNHFQTSDKTTLHYIFLRKDKLDIRSKVPTIIYLHGNAGNIGHRLENALEMFESLNSNIFMPEYRGYGLSTGRPSENGLYLDTIASLEFLHNRTDINHSLIVIFGRSLGGAVAIGSIAKISNNQHLYPILPRGLIVENTFTSVPNIAKKMANEQMNPIIAKLISFLPSWFYRSRFDSFKNVKNIDIPILFISGLKDELLPASMMDELFNTAKTPYKKIEHFVNGTHNFTWKCSNYYSTIDTFLVELSNNQEWITNSIINNNDDCIAIPISELERSPLIVNEDSEWRMLCNTAPI